ncbi:MAG TPA: chromosome segregation protein SMC [Candidatus Eisenbergiella pullistercoris]|uniref:Chromosome partition protein Smc n=1 Tax=Candidatus Eisenbergiella pullistercoris TaxID=2838555 RepID=A0A9D1YP16_9FIRM|nr:chromosome segregation protein SMC [Candidatus Eisenbergiella pullistercoris]
MYLKSIEVHGFKSFANKIKFEFHNGITGIVGPNGSGKSNVADAVRWVLGEQRVKQLRGASMQDVIFSGTEARKPMSYAYVAITLDNSDHQLAVDYDEVTVARRIYRSGESEYLMNGTPCRLKDVNELFYDTGIGKEGYSIIGQGQIDRILSGKPEERRELFDEAAGIVKFKRRKAAAQKKLEDEKQNLLRVRDILSELEKQTGPLERQSEKARIYLKKKEEQKRLDVNAFLLENSRLSGQLSELNEKHDNASRELAEATQQYDRIREEYENVQGEIDALDKSIEQTRTELSDAAMLRSRLEGEINVLKEQINSARSNGGHLENRKETLEKQIEERTKEREKLTAGKAETDQSLSEMEEKRIQAAELLSAIQAKAEETSSLIDGGRNRIIEELNERAAIKTRMERFDTMLEQIQIRRAELNSRLLRARSEEEQQETGIHELEEEFNRINERIGSLNASISAQEERLNAVRDELAKKDQAVRDTQVVYHQEKSRLDALVNLTERYEGYGGSVKRVMEQREKHPGILGVVADLLKVDKKYETAIETALGGSIQNIVTDNEDTAKEMIAFLKAVKGGRATFLPLTSVKNRQEFRQRQLLSEPGVIGLADSLVTTQDKYRDVAASLLGRILVVDHVDNAVRLARKAGYSLRMVTLEGELFTPGGAISGGAFKNSSNLLGRRREIEQLEERVRQTLKQVDALLEEAEELRKTRAQLRVKLDLTKEELQQEFIRQNTARMNVAAAREKKEQTLAGYDSLKKEQEEITDRLSGLHESKGQTERELAASGQREKDLEAQIASAQEELEKIREEQSSQAAKVSSLETETEKIRQTQGFAQENLDRISGELARFEEEKKEVLEGIEENGRQMREKEEQIRSLTESLSASGIAGSEGQLKLQAEQERKEELSARQKRFFEDRENLSAALSGLDKEVYRLNAQREKTEEAIENQINYMWEEYELTPGSAAALRDETLQDLTAMKKEIAALKDEIRKLGDVNVNAIEDYKNLMERYTFLKGQHDDLVQAEETLQGIILQLDEAMRRQFRERFSLIAREFDKVFKELFGGGKGTLELMEDEDILEAGIRIIAQPPGKKLQNMMQLSGGEKALTAIALLFAIQNLKPSPFCLLDEIEAALDDSNVGRFAGYLHKLTAHTQFIVITHRRGTMERADRLYGITMQEKGVSTLVSVSLIDKELTN